MEVTEIKNLIKSKYDLIKKLDTKEITKEEYTELLQEIDKQITQINMITMQEKRDSLKEKTVPVVKVKTKVKKVKVRRNNLKIKTDDMFESHVIESLLSKFVTNEHKLIKKLQIEYPYKTEMEILNDSLKTIKKIKDGKIPNIKWNHGKYSVLKTKQTLL